MINYDELFLPENEPTIPYEEAISKTIELMKPYPEYQFFIDYIEYKNSKEP